MAAKRSPILGYNHNVRFRGVVFHVQTEDSGLTNPHVFTHLFHGGVILSTRKLVYDPDASEEAVKSLMQSQHKAVLRDLKSGSFDDKIDSYLAGTPGLLPRGTEDNGVSTRAETHDDVAMSRAPTESQKDDAPPPVAPADKRSSAMPSIPTRTQPANPVPPPPKPAPRSAMTPPPVVARPVAEEVPQAERREVSQAFKAMQLADDPDIAAEVHSPAPPSAAVPPGAQPERPGSYAQHRKRESGPMQPIAPARRDSVPPPVAPPPAPPAVSRSTTPPRPGDVVRARPPTPGPRAPTVQGPPQPQRFPGMSPPGQPPRVNDPFGSAAPGGPPRVNDPFGSAAPGGPPVARSVTPPAVGRSATPPVITRASTPVTQPPRARAPSGGGVVMSKPAVIVGAPPKVIGGAGSGPNAASAAPAPRAPSPSGRVRKAREESEGGMFGQDLISEKSLDEVILAYLSEDGTEE